MYAGADHVVAEKTDGSTWTWGSDMRGQDLETFKISYSQGRALTASDQGSVVVGADLVKKLSAKWAGSSPYEESSSR